MKKNPEPRPGIMQITPYKQGGWKAKSTKKIIKLSSNETSLGPSPKAVAAYLKAAKILNRYNDGSSPELRQAIAKVHGLNWGKIVCGAGSDELIALIIQAYAGVGDEILYSEHGFLMYPISALKVGAVPVKAREKNLRADPKSILESITEKTKIIFLANPNNPTGSYLTAREMQELRAKIRAHILLVIDSAYAEYVTAKDYSDGCELAEKSENTIVLHTFSKIYGLAGLRLGWSYSCAEITDVLNRVRGPFNVSTPAQLAGIAAISDKKFTSQAVAHNKKWLPWLSGKLENLGLKVYPSAANFILVEFPGGKKSAQAADEYLKKHGIIVRRMEAYSLPKCLRITIGLATENQAVFAALTEFMQS